MMISLLLAVVATVLAYGLAPLLGRLAVRLGAVDIPERRKIHDQPIPRLGGLAVVGALGITVLLDALLFGQLSRVPQDLVMGLGLGVIPILCVSMVDDLGGVSPRVKLMAHFAGAAIAVACGVSLGADIHLFGKTLSLGILAIPLSVFWIVGVTNAFNLIDGLDGLAAGLALIAAASLAAVFAVVGQPVMAGVTLILAGALAGFLPHNLHPARFFLGDTGATAIGFCLAAFALRGGSTLSGGVAVLVPVIIMGLPIADTLVAIARRGLRRLEHHNGGVFTADRNHIHHRLLALGIDHRRAVLVLYGAGLLCAGVAFVSMFLNVRDAALFTATLLLAGLIGIHRLGYDEFAFFKRGMVLKALDAPVLNRSMFVVFIDVAVVLVAAYVAVSIETDAWHLTATGPGVIDVAGIVAPLTVLLFWRAGLYRGSWRLAGAVDFVRLCGVTSSVAVVSFIGHSLLTPTRYSPSLFVVYGLASLVLITASRASYVVLLMLQRHTGVEGTPVLVYGAGGRGRAAVQELYRDSSLGLRPIGFVDDDDTKLGARVCGLPIVGSISTLERTLGRRGAEALLIATSKLRPDRLERVRAICRRKGTSLFGTRSLVEPFMGQTGRQEPDARPVAESGAKVRVLDFQPSDYAVRAQASGSTPCPRPLSGLTCSVCGSPRVYRSRSKGGVERVRKTLTDRRPYRCGDCGWRGWLTEVEGYDQSLSEHSDLERPALSGIDQLLDAHASSHAGHLHLSTDTRVSRRGR